MNIDNTDKLYEELRKKLNPAYYDYSFSFNESYSIEMYEFVEIIISEKGRKLTNIVINEFYFPTPHMFYEELKKRFCEGVNKTDLPEAYKFHILYEFVQACKTLQKELWDKGTVELGGKNYKGD